MSTTAPVRPATGPAGDPPPGSPHPGGYRRADLAVALVCLAGALYLTGALWLDPYHRVVAHNQGDQALFEWLLGYQAYAAAHLHDPLWTTLLNAPVGVNLAVNTSMIAVGTVMAPVTLTLGAPVAFLAVLTANLALTPYAWYHVLSRHVTRTRAAAVLGGLFTGLAPGMVSHGNGHLNFTGQFLVPLIAWRVVSLHTAARPLRAGAVLGLLVALEFSIGAEMAFFVALACAVFVGLWALWHRADARTAAPAFLRGLAATAAVCLVLLAYPLYLQFAGPQRYHGIGFEQRVHSEDLAAFGAFPYLSVARLAGGWTKLAPNLTEETTFFGPLLLVLIVACAVLLWRRRGVPALALTGLFFAVLALGPWLHVGNWRTPVPLPYRLLAPLPVFDSALPARFALIVIPVAAILLALLLDRVLAGQAAGTAAPGRAGPAGWPGRYRRRWLAGYALALVPLLPLPVPAAPRQPVPVFVSSGHWRHYLHSGQTLVPVPPASDLLPDGQRWQVAGRFGFAIPAGFFLGPGPDGRSQIGPDPRPTAELFTDAARFGAVPLVTDADRAQARADLGYWHAGLVVLSDGGAGSSWTARQPLLLSIATQLFGAPERVDDVWLWRVG